MWETNRACKQAGTIQQAPIWTTSFGISSAYSNTAFPRRSAYVVTERPPLISAHPLGQDIKQASLLN